jgi:putative transferase (TIGR04331 family)
MSTGFFESMMLNRPVILLFEKKLINVDESFTKWIKKLKLSKICFDNLNEANNFLNHEFRNLNKWWNTKNLQRVRLEFCNNFARSPEKFSDNLYKFVK